MSFFVGNTIYIYIYIERERDREGGGKSYVCDGFTEIKTSSIEYPNIEIYAHTHTFIQWVVFANGLGDRGSIPG